MREARLEAQAIRNRRPREAAFELAADRAAGGTRGVAPARADPAVACGFEPQRSVSQHGLPFRAGAEREPHAGRLDVAARRDAVDAGRAEVEAARAKQRVEALDRRVRRVFVAGRTVVLEHQVRRAGRVELITDLEVQERRAVVEVAASDAADGAAGVAFLERGLDLVVPLRSL